VKPLKTFRTYTDDAAAAELLDEGRLRQISAFVLFQRISDRADEVAKSNNLDTQLAAIASQNVNLAMMIFAMTELLPKTNRKGNRR